MVPEHPRACGHVETRRQVQLQFRLDPSSAHPQRGSIHVPEPCARCCRGPERSVEIGEIGSEGVALRRAHFV